MKWRSAQPLWGPAWATRACSQTQEWQSVSEETPCWQRTEPHAGSHGWRTPLLSAIQGETAAGRRQPTLGLFTSFLFPVPMLTTGNFGKWANEATVFSSPYQPKVAILNVWKEIFILCFLPMYILFYGHFFCRDNTMIFSTVTNI